MRSFRICTAHLIKIDQNEDELEGICSTHGRYKACIQCFGRKTIK
jgi:hypothetical protein